MSFLKKIFSGTKTEPAARRVEHADDLRPGDSLKLKSGPAELAGQSFKVTRVDTYVYGPLGYPESAISRAGQEFYLMYEDEDGDKFISVAKMMSPTEMEAVFEAEDLRDIAREMMIVAGLAPDDGAASADDFAATLRVKKPGAYRQWLSDRYRLEDRYLRGYFVEGDARYLSDEELAKRKEPFLDWVFVDEDDEKAVEFQLFDTGEVETALIVYLEPGDLAEMRPGTFRPPIRIG